MIKTFLKKCANSSQFSKFIFYSLLALIIITLPFCSQKKSDSINIAILDGPSAISFIKLIDKPITIAGKNLDISIKSDPQQIQALLMQEQVDFAILPTNVAANLYNKGVGFKVVALPIWGTIYILSRDLNIKNTSDLKGQTISVFGQGATPDILLRKYIADKNIANVDIDYSYQNNHDIAQALLHKKIDIAVVSEPLVSILTNRDPSIKIVTKLDCEEFIQNSDRDIFAQTSFIVSNKFSADYPDLVNQVCDAYRTSCNFVNEHPNKASELIIKHKFASNIDVAKKSIKFCNIQYTAAFAVESELNKYLNIFYEFEPQSIGGKIPDKNFIYNTQL